MLLFPTLVSGLALAVFAPAVCADKGKLDLSLRGSHANASVAVEVSGKGPNDHTQLGRYIANDKTFEVISRRRNNDTTRGYRFLLSTARWTGASLRFEIHSNDVNNDDDTSFDALRVTLKRIIEIDSTNRQVASFEITDSSLWSPPSGSLVQHSSGAQFIKLSSTYTNGLVIIELTGRLSPVDLSADATLDADLHANKLYYGLKISNYQQQIAGSRMAIVKNVFVSSEDVDESEQGKGGLKFGHSQLNWKQNVTLTGSAAATSGVDVVTVASVAFSAQNTSRTDVEVTGHQYIFVIQQPLPFTSVTWDPEVGSTSSVAADDGIITSAGSRVGASFGLLSLAFLFIVL